MADQSHLLDAPAHDGDDQSTNQDCGEAICATEVPGRNGDYSHWSQRPGLDLDEGAYYRVPGAYLNKMYQLGVTNFNEASAKNTNKNDVLFTYSEAFWNGYGCAIANARDCVRHYPIDPEVQ